MAMGKRKQERQGALFVAADRLPKAAGHPFYQRLNGLLAEAGFDAWIEGRCRQYYETKETRGRPSIAPGVYFRMLLVGYFRGNRQPARNRLAVRGQPGSAAVLGAGAG
jgi:hypothetical protein